MFRTEDVQTLVTGGGHVIADDGAKIGSIGQVYLDDETSQPEWVTTKTGLFGAGESFVPLRDATLSGNDIRVPFDKNTVKDAPRIESSDGHLSENEEAQLYRYYGIDYSDAVSDSGLPAQNGDAASEGVPGPVGRDVSGPTTDNAMTRSEERVSVGTRAEEVGRARLRKYVVTENATQTVPVRKEKAVLEREPITEENVDAATAGPDISEEEHEITLSEERPVVAKETVPVERVRLGKSEVQEEQTLTAEVRKEQIQAEGDIENAR